MIHDRKRMQVIFYGTEVKNQYYIICKSCFKNIRSMILKEGYRLQKENVSKIISTQVIQPTL